VAPPENVEVENIAKFGGFYPPRVTQLTDPDEIWRVSNITIGMPNLVLVGKGEMVQEHLIIPYVSNRNRITAQ